MANGYLRIKKADIYENNGITYWKNGANIIGNVVKCVDSDETEHYYIESLKTKKAILLDDDVKIGGGDFGFESTNGNFILVTTGEVDFSNIGGGNGVSITFTFGNRYYTVTLPEDNGDLKIYDPDGEGGETGGNSAIYLHRCYVTMRSLVYALTIQFYTITDSETFDAEQYIKDNYTNSSPFWGFFGTYITGNNVNTIYNMYYSASDTMTFNFYKPDGTAANTTNSQITWSVETKGIS